MIWVIIILSVLVVFLYYKVYKNATDIDSIGDILKTHTETFNIANRRINSLSGKILNIHNALEATSKQYREFNKGDKDVEVEKG